MAATPASLRGERNAAVNAMTPPWENPPRRILSLGMPSAMASSMSAETYAADSSVRSRSSTLPSMDRSAMSYQPAMRMPPLRVTGMVGAVGNTQCARPRRASGTPRRPIRARYRPGRAGRCRRPSWRPLGRGHDDRRGVALERGRGRGARHGAGGAREDGEDDAGAEGATGGMRGAGRDVRAAREHPGRAQTRDGSQSTGTRAHARGTRAGMHHHAEVRVVRNVKRILSQPPPSLASRARPDRASVGCLPMLRSRDRGSVQSRWSHIARDEAGRGNESMGKESRTPSIIAAARPRGATR